MLQGLLSLFITNILNFRIKDTPLIEDTQTEVSDYKDENLGIVNMTTIYQIDSDPTAGEISNAGEIYSIHDNIMRLDKENKELEGKVRALEEEKTLFGPVFKQITNLIALSMKVPTIIVQPI